MQISSSSDMLLHEKFEQDFNETIQFQNLKMTEFIDQGDFFTLYSNLGFFKAKAGEQQQIEEIFSRQSQYHEQSLVPVEYAKNFARCI